MFTRLAKLITISWKSRQRWAHHRRRLGGDGAWATQKSGHAHASISFYHIPSKSGFAPNNFAKSTPVGPCIPVKPTNRFLSTDDTNN